MRGGINAVNVDQATGAPVGSPTRRHAVESWTATADDVRAWLKHSHAGDSLVYARGPSLVRGAAAALVGQLIDTGEVRSHNRRAADGGLEFFIVRKAKRPAAIVAAPVFDPPMLAVLTVIQSVASMRQRCPSNQAIGEATVLSVGQVKWALEKLERAAAIKVTCAPVPGEPKFRVVEVVATGCRTAGPAL